MVESSKNGRADKLLAEAPSLNVLERIILKVLQAAGMMDGGAKDRWEEGSAQTSLRTSRGAAFVSKVDTNQPTTQECNGECESNESHIDPEEETATAAEDADDDGEEAQ